MVDATAEIRAGMRSPQMKDESAACVSINPPGLSGERRPLAGLDADGSFAVVWLMLACHAKCQCSANANAHQR